MPDAPASEPPTAERLAWHAQRLARLPLLQERLGRATGVGELLAEGAELARTECGFARGLVVAIRDGRLTADATDALSDPASDALRLRVLADPSAIVPGTVEAELVRRAGQPIPQRGEGPSTLGDALDLEHPALGLIAPQSAALGLLVLDRPAAEIGPLERSLVSALAAVLAGALEHVILRARIAELSSELRYLTVSARALAREAFEAPISLPVQGRHAPAFRSVEGAPLRPSPSAAELLSTREAEIAALLARGRSNRDIAGALHLSPETVKDNVARIARKLGATNRVEAAIRFLGLEPEPPSGGR
jgi:DNA-binding CsgD family transcriptional regulator